MTVTDYRNFDLLIARFGDRYRAFVVDAPEGDASVVFDPPLAADETIRLGDLGRGVRRADVAAGKIGPAANLTDLGQRLFAAVFQDKVGTLLAASLSSVAQEGAGLRLRLRFEEDAADLAILPWETLYDPFRGHFIALGEQSPIVRYLPLPRSRSALLVEPPLRVLAVLSSPAGLPPLDMEREWQAIQDALAGLTAGGKFVLERLQKPTLAALQERLLGEPVHILHFVGHGVFDEAAQAGSLALEDARGRPHLVRGEQLAALLRNHPAMRLAYLNACEGALASGESVFTGVAQTLVREGVPAAVAMQAEISDSSAIELARTFYTALAAGRPVDAALTQARVALSVAGSPEWAIPVLFSRSPDNRLFDIRQVLPTPDCPYPGMTPFSEAQRALFFGRDKEIEDAVERLRQHPFLTVVGPSGSGKSSLIYAGVIPALRRSKRFGPGAWDIKLMRPGQKPLAALAEKVGCSPETLSSVSFTDRTLLFVDQFEEIFTLTEAGEAQAFLDALSSLIGRPNLHILLTVRADFYPELMACFLWQPIRANRLELTPLGDDELWAAIVEPAARVGVEVDEALAVKLIADASGQKGVLPLVQETLVLLWDKVKSRRLKLEAYKEMGESGRSGLQVAIDRRATTVYHNLPDGAQPIARRIFLRLIQFGEGRADTRRQQTAAELRASGDDPALFDQTLAKLTESRLLTASGDTEGAERRVDIAHEALIAGWPRLQAWLDQRRAAEQTRRRLESKAAEWVAAEKRGGLLDEYELQEAETWLAGEDARELGYSQELVDLVVASKVALAGVEAEKEAQRQRELAQAQKLAEEQRLRAEEGEKAASSLRKRLIMATAAVVIALVALGAAVGLGRQAQINANAAEAASTLAVEERNNAVNAAATATVALGQAEVEAGKAKNAKATAEAEKSRADERAAEAKRQASIALSRQLLAQSSEQLGTDKERALLLAVKAAQSDTNWSSDSVLRQALASPGHTHWFSPTLGTLPVWSHSGRELLITGAQNEVLIMDAGSKELRLVPTEYGGVVPAMAWSPDNTHFLIRVGAETQVWTPQATRPIAVAQRGLAPWWSYNAWGPWSPDGSRIILSDSSGLYLWAWREDQAMPVDATGSSTVGWSADARYFHTLGDDGLRVWNAVDGSERELTPEINPAKGAVWNPKDSRLLIIGGDGRLRVWNMDDATVVELATDEAITPPQDRERGDIVIITDGDPEPSPIDWRNHVTWSPDGTRILTFKDQVQVWNADDGSKLADLTDKPSDGSKIHSLTAYWNPDGQRVLIDDDQQVSIFYLDGSRIILRLSGLRSINGSYSAISQPWSPNGTMILSAERNKLTVRDADTGAQIATLTSEADIDITEAEWSPNGEYVLGRNDTNQVRIWSLDPGLKPIHLEGSFGSWSPDGAYLVTRSGSLDKAVARVWNANTGSEIAALEAQGQSEQVSPGMYRTFGIDTWSPDGRSLMIYPDHTVIRIWSAIDWRTHVDLRGHRGQITDAMWVPVKGDRVATASEDGTVRIWNSSTGETIHVFEGHESAVNDLAWSPDGAYIASAGSDKTIRIWQADTGEPVQVLKGHSGSVASVNWNPQVGSPLLLSERDYSERDDTARVWNIQTGEQVAELVGDGSNINTAEWNVLGTHIATVTDKYEIYLWQQGGFRKLDGVSSPIAWSPDGINLASAKKDATIVVWNVRSGSGSKEFVGHAGDVNSIDWSLADPKSFVSHGDDGKIRLWNLESTTATAVIDIGDNNLSEVIFSPSGHQTALWDYGESLRVYPTLLADLTKTACQIAVRNLGPADWQEFILPQEVTTQPYATQPVVPDAYPSTTCSSKMS